MSAPDAMSDPRAVAGLVESIAKNLSTHEHRYTFMEVCGTHTHAVARSGIRRMLPEQVRLVSGPGCPVCVTPVGYLDRALALAARPDTLVCTFGDLMRVPSSTLNLEEARAEGHNVEIVYSPRDALAKAADDPDLQVVFLAVGFETTVPTIAAALAEAESRKIPNFSILPGNKVMPPPMRALSGDPELQIDGFLLPGHVSVITGSDAFNFLSEEYGVSGAVVGFAPADILRGVAGLVELAITGTAAVRNLYGRVVSAGGNSVAWHLVEQFFEAETAVWRGFGEIPGSGLALKKEWSHRDASTIALDLPTPREPEACRCGEVLRGSIDPPECGLFATVCTPDDPVGACMVSSEGSCAAWYRHERFTAGAGR